MKTYIVTYKSSAGNGEKIVAAENVYEAHAKGQPHSGRVISITQIQKPTVVESITPESEEKAIEASHADPTPVERDSIPFKKRGRPKR